MKTYPARSFTRIFVFISISIYMWGRFVDPGPVWIQEMIEMLIHTFNLEFIQRIALAAPQNLTFWQGSGFALQIQLLFTWPLVWIFAASAGWLSRHGSREFDKYPPIIKVPTFSNCIKNLLPVLVILLVAYYPFQGSDIYKVDKSTGPFAVIEWDTFPTSIFWMVGGWIVIYLSMVGFYVITSELKLIYKKDN